MFNCLTVSKEGHAGCSCCIKITDIAISVELRLGDNARSESSQLISLLVVQFVNNSMS